MWKLLNTEKKIALTIFCIFLTLYVFTNDGHRHTIDEEITLRQATWLTTLTPHPDFELGDVCEVILTRLE